MAERKQASIEIKAFNVEGEPVELPVVLDLETTYTFQVTVTNLTETRGGKPWEALLEVGVGVSLDGIDLGPYSVATREFTPNQSVSYPAKIYIRSDYAGMTGRVIVKVFDPFGAMLASAQKRFTIGLEVSPEVAYKVTAGAGAKGIDMPFLNPALDNQEGVVIGGAVSRPPSPPPQPAPKINHSKGKPPPGIDLTSEPELEVEFEGETVVSDRLG